MFILIEGLDGMGKTTLITQLSQYLNNLGYLYPKNIHLSNSIRKLFTKVLWSDYLSLLILYIGFLLNRRNKDLITSIGNPYFHVFMDRYWLSSLCYQLGTNKPEFLNKVFIWLCKYTLPTPDITIWLDGTVDLAINRIKGRPSFDPLDKHMERYEKLCEVHKNYSYYTLYLNNIYKVEANQTMEEIIKDIIPILIQYLKINE